MYTWRPPLVSLSLSTSEESRVGRRCVFFVAGIESQGVSVWPVWGGPLFHSRNFRNLLMFTNPLSGVYCSDHWFQHRLVLGWFLYREEKYGPSPVCSTGFFHMQLHPPRLTWNLKMMVWKMFLLFQGCILRFHVNLARCIFWIPFLPTSPMKCHLRVLITAQVGIGIPDPNDYDTPGNDWHPNRPVGVDANRICKKWPSFEVYSISGVDVRTRYLPETNILHLKMDGWKTSFLLEWPIFRCYSSGWCVLFFECFFF